MEVSSELADAIVRHVHSPDYRPAKPKQILRELHLEEDQYREVRRTVKWLVQRGQLVYAANHLVLPVSYGPSTGNSVTGTFSLAAAGFGFIRQQSFGKDGE